MTRQQADELAGQLAAVGLERGRQLDAPHARIAGLHPAHEQPNGDLTNGEQLSGDDRLVPYSVSPTPQLGWVVMTMEDVENVE